MLNAAIYQEEQNFMHNVVWLRKHHGISKKRMSKLLGIGIGSLNKIERGEMPLRLKADGFINIHRNFGIRPNDQLTQRLDEK